MVESSTGVGSIWNKNSWHWEERNYTDLAKKFLSENLIKIVVENEANPACTIRLYEIKSIEGSCSITIRKQKQIFLYDFKLDIYFDAVPKEDIGEEKAMGRVLIDEFNQDDDDLPFDIVCERPTEYVNQVKKVLKTKINAEILRVVNELKSELKQIDANEEKIRKDQQDREKAASDFEEAKKNAGEMKQQIFEDQKKKEAVMKEQAQKLLAEQQNQQPQKVEKVQGQGSVWNTNSYFWEEKSVGKWAEARFKEVVGSFRHEFPGGVFTISEVSKIEGEASVSIRKGKKIVSYDYNCKLLWELVLKDGEGKEVGKMKGEYEMPEVSSDIDDDGEDWEIKTTFKQDEGKLKSRFENLVRKEIPKTLRKVIKEQFVNELKAK